MDKVTVALTDGTWLEGERVALEGMTNFYRAEAGIYLNNVHRSDKEARQVPIAKRVFVPYTAILFIILEE